MSVNFVGKWTPVLALAGGPRVQYKRHGAEGLRLTHKGSKGFLSGEDKQQVLEWIREQTPSISKLVTPPLTRRLATRVYFRSGSQPGQASVRSSLSKDG